MDQEIALSHFLSKSGIIARRKGTDAIKNGLVTVNGQFVTTPFTKINPDRDIIKMQGQTIKKSSSHTYLALHKPIGYTCTKSDKYAEKTIYELLPKKYHQLHSIGRLDKNSQGLLILTSNGDLTHKLTHPKFGHEKEYFLKISGMLTTQEKTNLEKGITLNDGKTAPAHIHIISQNPKNSTLTIIIREGKKRQIRRMFEKFRHTIMLLERIRIGTIKLDNLSIGSYRLLKPSEIADISQ